MIKKIEEIIVCKNERIKESVNEYGEATLKTLKYPFSLLLKEYVYQYADWKEELSGYSKWLFRVNVNKIRNWSVLSVNISGSKLEVRFKNTPKGIKCANDISDLYNKMYSPIFCRSLEDWDFDEWLNYPK